MKGLLLSAGVLISGISMTVAASVPQGESLQSAYPVSISKVTNNPVAAKDLKRLAPGVTVTTAHGRKQLHMLDESLYGVNSLDLRARVAAKAGEPDGYVLFESFEDWDGADVNWTPDGWSVEMKGTVDKDESWNPSGAHDWDPNVPDGDTYFKISYNTSGTQDEWLVSPYVEVGDNMELSYWLYLEPIWLYVLDEDHVDWDTGTFIGDHEVAATLQIWAQAEGEEWVMLRDYADEYDQYSYLELAYMTPTGLEKNVVSLNEFYGKKTRVGFRYVGSDGNITYIDAVGIGYPTIDEVMYLNPSDMQYWGLTRSCDMIALQTPIAIYPANYPITWTNENMQPNIRYKWTYTDPDTGEAATSDDADELTVTYKPSYSTDLAVRDNFYQAPVLYAEADNCMPAQYQAPFTYLQAGGKPEMMSVAEEIGAPSFTTTIMPFNLQELDLTITLIDDPQVGDMALPVYGHNVNVDRYWLNYSLNGEEYVEGDYSRLIGIANLIWPTNDAPLVVNGVNVYGYGKISPDAELSITIYAVNSSLSTELSDLTMIATASIKGSEIICQDESGKSYMCLPFDFDEPAVMRATEDYPAFFVMFNGFNSDQVEYFAPLQSKLPDTRYICKAYMLNHIDLSNHVERPAYYSLKTIRYIMDGEYISGTGAFAIGLDAEYPWLTTDCEGLILPNDGSAVEVPLDSYYDGSKLTVEAPAGINATVSGRYDKCVLTVSAGADSRDIVGDIVVKGPGVEVRIPVELSGINMVNADNQSAVIDVYDVSGRRIDAATAGAGVYVVKYADGTTGKLVIK